MGCRIVPVDPNEWVTSPGPEYSGDPGLIVELVSDIRESIDYAVQNAFNLSERDRKRIHGCLYRAREELQKSVDIRTVQLVREDHE